MAIGLQEVDHGVVLGGDAGGQEEDVIGPYIANIGGMEGESNQHTREQVL